VVRTIVLREDVASAFPNGRQTICTCMGSVIEFLTEFTKTSDGVIDLASLEDNIKKVVKASIKLTDPDVSPTTYDVRFHYSPDRSVTDIEIGLPLSVGVTVASNPGILRQVH